jgi:hypothetical protein
MNEATRDGVSASAPTGVAFMRSNILSDAIFAAAISTRGITYRFWITKARCRIPRRIKLSSATDHQRAPVARANLAGAMSSSHRAYA